jgi:hypothetical protein
MWSCVASAKGERELACLAVYLAIGIDLRLMDGGDFRRTQIQKDAPAIGAQADGWLRALRERGWERVSQPADAPITQE